MKSVVLSNLVMNVIMNFKEVVLGLAIANFIIAILLLVWPNIFSKVNETANKWISVEKVEEILNKRRDIDSGVMKARKVVGFISVALAILLLFIYFKKM